MEILSLPVAKGKFASLGVDSEVNNECEGKTSEELEGELQRRLLRECSVVGIAIEGSSVYLVSKIGSETPIFYVRFGSAPKPNFLKTDSDQKLLKRWSGVAQSLDPVSGVEDLELRSCEFIPDAVDSTDWILARVLFMCCNGDSLHVMDNGTVAWHMLETNEIIPAGFMEDFLGRYFSAICGGHVMTAQLDMRLNCYGPN